MTAPRRQLERFIDKYSPEIALRARAVLAKMRALIPGAVELVYDNYGALVIGFGPNERASDAPLSIGLYTAWINLYFLRGAGLPDPHKRLRGEGKIVRRIVLETSETLDDPIVIKLITHALSRTEPIDPTRPARIVIKAIAPNQRPRRPKH